MRVHELAKEVGLSSKEVVAQLADFGVEAKNHMSVVEEEAIALLKEASGQAKKKPEKAAKPTKAKKKPEKAEKPKKAAKEEKKAKKAPKAEKEEVVEAPEPPPVEEEAPKAELKDEPQAEPEPQEEAPKDDEKSAGNVISVRGAVTVKELADLLSVRPNQLITELMRMNILASLTERIDINVVREIVEKHGMELEYEKKAAGHSQGLNSRIEVEDEEEDKPEDYEVKAPVVVFLGHVDHGKTSLLDKIRDTAVTKGESGGITQHIGAYTVEASGKKITFLDTPGHAAFNAMRERGANLTDIAVIIIAADDGIMPQTKEAIKFARNANVDIMIAINKTDLPGANVDNVKKQLQADGMTPDDWGGDVVCCEVSAITGDGIDHLLEMILLNAEMLELKANPKRRAQGYVIEAQLEPGMGPTANLLVASGTLSVGNFVLCGAYCGKVRALVNDHGVKVKSVPPATPVKLLGLSGVPEAGMEFRVCANEKSARLMAEQAKNDNKTNQLTPPRESSVEALFSQIEQEAQIELKVIIKADTQGSVEAIIGSLEQIKSDKATLTIVQSGTGNITENDIAQACDGGILIMGFHVSNEPGVKAATKRTGVEVHIHTVIYELIDEVKNRLVSLLPPLLKQNVRGSATIKQTFAIGRSSKIAGCIVTNGYATRQCIARIKRGDEILAEEKISSLKHFQDEVSDVKAPQECGLCFGSFISFEENDIIEFFEVEELKQEL